MTPPGRAGVARTFVATALLCATALGCAGPTTDPAVYREMATETAAAMTGILTTARIAAELGLAGRMLPTVTDTMVSDAESDAGSVQTTFGSRQPPDAASDAVREAVTTPVQDATSALADLRIAVRRGDAAAVRAALVEVRALTAEFRRLQQGPR